jgi:DNA polymerase-3 subunit delta
MGSARPGDLDRLIERWDKELRLLLFAGRDEGASRLLAERAAAQLADGEPPTSIEGAALAAEPGRLADAAASIPLFGTRQVVRVSGTPSELRPAIAMLLATAAAGNPVVATTGALVKSDPLHALVEASPKAVLVLNHPPAQADLARFVMAEGARHGLRIPREAAAQLIETAGTDRSILATEVEKLALYVGATPEGPASATMEDVAAVTAGGGGEEETGRLALAILAGDGKAIAHALGMTARADAIPALRQLGSRLLQLIELAPAVAGGESPRAAIERARPPVFWKEQEPLAQALRRWTPPALEAALGATVAAEAAIKARGSAGEIVALQTLAMLGADAGVWRDGGFD